ncbi:hypothetical protein I553_7689 [Mycobacterium xenopi 4042]|uniref:Uncharacterized protein n=1 Tax=Mycobacterium xenopi 4042 TaxID=1299334 RepID=X8ANX7_MYCXE|nr:hypothetical protein I553_7689 [Mycobacterium xenopi 4042]
MMYGVGGERILEEQELPHLSGYDHARPVRIGNGAYKQNQHDIWGAILDSFYLHARSREQVPRHCGRCSKSRSKRRRRTGASPTAASGRCAANPSISPRRR